jgi:hypothetical protein
MKIYRYLAVLCCLFVSFRQACVDEPGAPAPASRGHNSDAFFSPKIEPLAFFFHAVSG